MAESVYRVTEVIGVSSESWELARVRNAIEVAGQVPRPAYRRGRPPG